MSGPGLCSGLCLSLCLFALCSKSSVDESPPEPPPNSPVAGPHLWKMSNQGLLLKVWVACQSSLERWPTLVVKLWLLNLCRLLQCFLWHLHSDLCLPCVQVVASPCRSEIERVFPLSWLCGVAAGLVWEFDSLLPGPPRAPLDPSPFLDVPHWPSAWRDTEADPSRLLSFSLGPNLHCRSAT